jgi:CTP synthase (UTP-ammonia lyase)
MVRIALVGDFNKAATAHQGIQAIRHLVPGLEFDWHHTGDLQVSRLSDYSGVWCVPGSPFANEQAALDSIRYARQNDVPFLGTCAGFQHAVLEYARNVLGHQEAQHAETAPEAADPLISRLACSLVEKEDIVRYIEGSRTREIVGAETIEGFHCNYGLSARWERAFEGTPLRISARSTTGEARAIELESHPFFLATLFQPERAALAGRVHPVVGAFLGQCGCAGLGPRAAIE